ncbi:lysophospholipid acyltransferase family protein [Xanthobacter sp. TB0139]|uniref:lysophospholipid acyltransferase family protein n=1 Tax=Xanthobacter sp. TB0139 TaxID=3459178 RepID=UPI0040397931
MHDKPALSGSRRFDHALDELVAPKGLAARILEGIRLGFVICMVLLATAIGIPLQWLALKLKWRIRRTIPMLYHRILLRCLGVKVRVEGVPALGRPLLVLSNHCSWLDIPVLGSRMPLFFVAKSEVAEWPLVGLLAKFQRTVFVNRQRRQATSDVNREIARRLKQGDPVVLFAEGTSSDGNRVLPFRTALVGAVRDAFEDVEQVSVQPLSISYVRLQGIPMGRQHRGIAAWTGDMELAPHLMEVLRQGAIDVTLSFGPELVLDAAHDRKSVTREAEASVRSMMVKSLSGHN